MAKAEALKILLATKLDSDPRRMQGQGPGSAPFVDEWVMKRHLKCHHMKCHEYDVRTYDIGEIRLGGFELWLGGHHGSS